MRKSILVFLCGLITGLFLFVNYEQANILLILLGSLVFGFVFYWKNSKLWYYFLALCLIFLSAKATLSDKTLRKTAPGPFKFTVYEKRKVDEGYRYFLIAQNNNIKEKTVAFLQEDLDIGEIFLARASFKEPRINTNPNLFSYRHYLASKGIFSEAKIKHIDKKIRGKHWGLRLRNSFYKYIHRIFDLNMSLRSANFCTSIVLGEALVDDVSIRELGLSHILAVSGLHIDLLFAFVFFIFKKLKVNYRILWLLALLLASLYAYLIDFPFSVMRVLGVNLIAYLAFLYKKPLDRIKALLIVAGLILIKNPFALLNAGFILSFASCLSIYLIYPRLKSKFGKSYIRKSIAFTSSIQLGLFPMLIYYFGRFNLVSIIANFLVLPIFNISMYLIFGLVFLYPIFGNLLKVGFGILDFLISSILNITGILAKLSLFKIDFARPSLILVFYGFMLILILVSLDKRIIKRKSGIFLLSALIIIISVCKDREKISYQMIDIGQGDCFLLKDMDDYYMVDVGGPKSKTYDSGERILVPYLKSLGVSKIKGIFISHEDKDHVGNIDRVCDNFDVENIYTSKLNIEAVKKYRPAIIKNHDRIKLSHGYIECIYEGADADENANSIGILINIKGIRILSLGDLQSEFEKDINTRADILKLSHHGSKTSSARDFIERVNPKVVLISAGRNNTYGHPSKEVLENVSDRIIYNTQTDGMVEMDFTNKFSIIKYLKGGYFR